MSRSVIVTGGFGVLGQAAAQAFAAQGDKVARIDFAQSAPSALERALDIGGVDLTDAGAAASMLAKVVDTQGGLDVLVNVAGGFVWETLEQGSVETWSKMHMLNVVTSATITQLALPELRKSPAGRIVNIGAGAATGKAGMGMGAYTASKSGVHRLTEALSEELAGTSVTVNAVLPSILDTPPNRADMPDADFSTWVSPAAAAKVIVFLASEDAGAINGALIPVSRGG